jgi:hypothetical protein
MARSRLAASGRQITAKKQLLGGVAAEFGKGSA